MPDGKGSFTLLEQHYLLLSILRYGGWIHIVEGLRVVTVYQF